MQKVKIYVDWHYSYTVTLISIIYMYIILTLARLTLLDF